MTIPFIKWNIALLLSSCFFFTLPYTKNTWQKFLWALQYVLADYSSLLTDCWFSKSQDLTQSSCEWLRVTITTRFSEITASKSKDAPNKGWHWYSPSIGIISHLQKFCYDHFQREMSMITMRQFDISWRQLFSPDFGEHFTT